MISVKSMRRKEDESRERKKVQKEKTARFRPTVPRSLLRSVGRLNFLPGPFTETKETGKKEVINRFNKKQKRRLKQPRVK